MSSLRSVNLRPAYCLIPALSILLLTAWIVVSPPSTQRYLVALIPSVAYHSSSPGIADITDDTVIDATSTNFPVHFVRLYPTAPGANDTLCWVQCVSLLSVLIYIKPSRIYIHTNYPDFWPFDTCNSLISNWTTVRLVRTRRRFVIGRHRLSGTAKTIRHEADLAKLFILLKHGGITLDFDVYVLPKISRLVILLEKKYDCIATQEDASNTNIGFLACRKGAAYVKDILQHYVDDYRRTWVYNSGLVPMQLYKNTSEHRTSVYMDQKIAMNPSWYKKKDMWEHDDRVDWRDKPAYHSFFTDCSVTQKSLVTRNTSLFQLFSSIVQDGRLTRG
ncbi:uncharacterized protein LOC129593169 [Paramacrobiotus metropolitanus]|uniref:uncharacterized protein LOC129593169 n=1 Tax=Paramacrobiotus metropolitanus TaxID=2943436 RepID=UPI0024460027|nr:uncharacterized protein LOC129593169 [Paramacrobiotus metropolitanus]